MFKKLNALNGKLRSLNIQLSVNLSALSTLNVQFKLIDCLVEHVERLVDSVERLVERVERVKCLVDSVERLDEQVERLV